MNIYITLDYELFFGKHSGSVENCIIKPTEALLKIVNPLKIKFTCFVDVGYLVKLEEQKEKYTQLKKDYQKITAQIKNLANQGHGMELHIHPHWKIPILMEKSGFLIHQDISWPISLLIKSMKL